MFHRVTIIGRVGQAPEMRYTPAGAPVCNFSVATTSTLSKTASPECPKGWKESYNGKNWELTTWWRVSCWRLPRLRRPNQGGQVLPGMRDQANLR